MNRFTNYISATTQEDDDDWDVPAPTQGTNPNGTGTTTKKIYSASTGPIIITSGGPGGNGGLVYTGNINGSMATSTISVAKTAKTDVKFVIIEKDGITCHILTEQSPITPREMIGIAKLMSTITTSSTTAYCVFNWSALVDNFGIRKHFIKSSTPRSALTFAPHIQVVWLQDPA